ncbi:MAG: hypothetical protein H6617_11590 [Bdellovibrionaceae bacterium]|nr:hypothetical protein [Bdellovibrionales bacterium]MCB9255315.1 hypothetical protein [Pseudobdellovibrionaceae bacterium]
MISNFSNLSRCRYFVTAILLLFLEAQTAVAANLSDALSLQQRFSGSSEYRAGNLPDSLLVPVRLLGAVPKAGVHYIPKRTDLVTLLSYAGGLLPSAEGYLIIKRRVGNEFKNYRLKLDRLADADENSIPLMQEDDLVYIPFFRPVIHPDTMQMISVVATVLSIAVSATVLIGRF